MAETNEYEAMIIGCRTDVGDVRRTYWVAEYNTMYHLGNELLTDTSTNVISHAHHTINCNPIFLEMGIVKLPIALLIYSKLSIFLFRIVFTKFLSTQIPGNLKFDLQLR